MKLKYEKLLSNCAFKFNLRRYAQSISFTPTASGTYEIDVDMSNSLISTSVKYASNAKVTVKLEVAPAAPDATRSVITGEGLTLGQVDVLGSFSVLTYDKYGNAVVTERAGAAVRRCRLPQSNPR